MLIFVSDLHLADHPDRSSFKAEPMFRAIRSAVAEAKTHGDSVKLVLLGDIFELLKSGVWFEKKVRPWSPPGRDLKFAAWRVLRRIYREPQNKLFFEELQVLREESGVELDYCPGNHDGLLADKDVPGLRARLRRMIPGLPGVGDEPFSPTFIDEAHGVVSEHGHQFDGFNRRAVQSGRFVAGDAVVVEMLVGLPRKVAGLRELDEFDAELEFLHEMDNVDPQTLAGLLAWLEFRMLEKSPEWRTVWESDVADALKLCGRSLRDAMKAHGAQGLARKALWTLTCHRIFTRISFLRKLARLPSPPSDELSEVEGRIASMAPTFTGWSKPPDVFVAGHTHSPLDKPFQTAKGLKMTYLNSGTWRRVQKPVRSLGPVAFSETFDGALVCVYRRDMLAAIGNRFELMRDMTKRG